MLARRVIEPVCQCSSCRPVVSTIGYSASGSSAGDTSRAGPNPARPLAVGKPFAHMPVAPVEAEAAGEGDEEVEVLARLSRQRQRLAAELDLAVGVGHRAVL